MPRRREEERKAGEQEVNRQRGRARHKEGREIERQRGRLGKMIVMGGSWGWRGSML